MSLNSALNALSDRPLRLVLLGGPGVGKGTQAELMIARFGMPHLSTGEIFRSLAKSGSGATPAMLAAMAAIGRGELVGDSTVIALVDERIDNMNLNEGLIFDGFPRTVPQAESLDQMLKRREAPLDGVVNYELPRELLIQRLSGRRTCPKCGASFHVLNRPPKVADICDQCGSQLIQRSDDKPESIIVRLQTYESATRPLTEFYAATGRLATVSADGAPEEVFERSLEQLRLVLAARQAH